MLLEVVTIPRETWISDFSEYAHVLGFNEQRPKERERISKAYLIVDGLEPVGYATILEMNDQWGYIQYGAAFKKFRSGAIAFIGMRKIMDRAKSDYPMLSTVVDARNIPAIRAFFKLGFIISGYKTIYGDGYAELLWEREKSEQLLTDFLTNRY